MADVPGMNLLEYYAGQALVGLVSNQMASGAIGNISNSGQEMALILSQTAWELAQAMLDSHPHRSSLGPEVDAT